MSERTWFDEGPSVQELLKPTTPAGRYVNTGGLDLAAGDPFRQGVELRLPGHRALGLAKLGTGEPDGSLRQWDFGSDAVPSAGPFVDSDSVGSVGSGASSSDGVLEPFAIRTLVQAQDDARLVRGALMEGTEDQAGRVPRITSQRPHVQAGRPVPFVDSCDVVGVPMQAAVDPGTVALLGPAQDDAVKSGVRVPTGADSALKSALQAMNPGTDTYLDDGWVSAGTGFTHGTPGGVDSVAFGSMEL